MKIARIDITPFEAAFIGGSYVMSYVTQTRLFTRQLRLTTDTGATGIGEIVRRPTVNRSDAEAAEDARLEILQGRPLADLPSFLNQWRAEGPMVRGLVFGVETAFLDLSAKAAGVPLSALLGGVRQTSVPLYQSISAADPHDMACAVRAHPNAPVLQPKLGTDDLDLDLARVEAVLGAAQPDQRVLADFNGALSLDDASKALPSLIDPRLMWEDPCLSYEDNAHLAANLATPVMADMSMGNPSDILRAISQAHLSAVAIKPHFVGGLSAARTAIEMCTAAGMLFRIDGPWSGPIGSAATLHLAQTTSQNLLYATADLTSPLTISNPFAIYPRDGYAAPTAGPGLGDAAPTVGSPDGTSGTKTTAPVS